ncbi:hypothetical protein OF83DRAFT_1069187 [Amylostereum chailletii]|nr:hypothetical protein OF83DRAFT_1069187 [Amylostereum chailletii]
MKLSTAQFIRDQLKKVSPVERADLSGKTILVVGANVGLGFEATMRFAAMNPERLILACRNKDKGEAAIRSACASHSWFISRSRTHVRTRLSRH